MGHDGTQYGWYTKVVNYVTCGAPNMGDDTRDDVEGRCADPRPFGKRDSRVSRPYRTETWELNPDEVTRLRFLLWWIAGCLSIWKSIVAGIIIGSALIWIPWFLKLIRGH